MVIAVVHWTEYLFLENMAPRTLELMLERLSIVVLGIGRSLLTISRQQRDAAWRLLALN